MKCKMVAQLHLMWIIFFCLSVLMLYPFILIWTFFSTEEEERDRGGGVGAGCYNEERKKRKERAD